MTDRFERIRRILNQYEFDAADARQCIRLLLAELEETLYHNPTDEEEE